MSPATIKSLGNAIGILVADVLRAFLFWVLYPALAKSILPGAVASGALAADLSFPTCFTLVVCIGLLSPLKTLGVTTPMKVKIDDGTAD